MYQASTCGRVLARAQVQVLQTSGSQMIVLRFTALSERDCHWQNPRKKNRERSNILGMSCPSWQWHRTGYCWSPVQSLAMASLWCDLGASAGACQRRPSAAAATPASADRILVNTHSSTVTVWQGTSTRLGIEPCWVSAKLPLKHNNGIDCTGNMYYVGKYVALSN